MSAYDEIEKLRKRVAACWTIGIVLAISGLAIVSEQVSYSSKHLFDGVGTHPTSWDGWHQGGSTAALIGIGALGLINTVILISASSELRQSKKARRSDRG